MTKGHHKPHQGMTKKQAEGLAELLNISLKLQMRLASMKHHWGEDFMRELETQRKRAMRKVRKG